MSVLCGVSAVNASYLGKNGAVSYLFKLLSVCGRKHLTPVKYALDTLALLVKSSEYTHTHLMVTPDIPGLLAGRASVQCENAWCLFKVLYYLKTK